MKKIVLVSACLGALLVAGLSAAAIVGPGRILAWVSYQAAESRLVTGIAVAGTPDSPRIYVSSSDPRVADLIGGEVLPVDTNSGVISVLERSEDGWMRRDLVEGLPRSHHDHATNGLLFDRAYHRLLVGQGSMTNMGEPSARFRMAPEYALSGAVLSVDLGRLGDGTYALPTLDDETRSGPDDAGDPFGGDGGRNQAMIVPGGPVGLYATGLRNPYDLVMRRGSVYTIDNGPNWYLGSAPSVVGGKCSNATGEGGRYEQDVLYRVDEGGYYGHPNPTRSSKAVTFNASHPQSPIDRARPQECAYRRADPKQVLTAFDSSTNGLAEYTASNFGGALTGDLLAVSFDRRLYLIELDESGRKVIGTRALADTQSLPLDVVAQPDSGPFPGTIWTADWISGNLIVLEPRDRENGTHWERLAPSGFDRQEVSWVRVGSRFYLAGGERRQEQYDPATDTWRDVAPLPERLDHIQGVALGGKIYYVGGLRSYPAPAVGSVWLYDPKTDTFSRGAPMPLPRGAGGVAVRDGRIYYAGGLSEGKAVAWFDVYDPSTDSWSSLPDMPRARDHFQAQVVGSRLYAIGGRNGDVDENMDDNDAYDFGRNAWVTGLAPLPTPRGGYASAVVGHEIVIFGGEAPDRVFPQVEAYDVGRNTWRALDPMPDPRHGIQAIVCAGDVYIAAGGERPYGDAPSSENSVYVTGHGGRCPLAPRVTKGRSRPAFRVVRIPTGLSGITSMQFGPDGRLYVAEQAGTIDALEIHRTDDGHYRILSVEGIDAIREIPNHDDHGAPAASWGALVGLVGRRLGVCCAFSRVLPPRASTAPPTRVDPERGRVLFRDANCAGCHALASVGSKALTGPPLDNASALPPAYLEQSIVDPDAVVAPGYEAGQMWPDYSVSLSTQQRADIIAFLREQKRK